MTTHAEIPGNFYFPFEESIVAIYLTTFFSSISVPQKGHSVLKPPSQFFARLVSLVFVGLSSKKTKGAKGSAWRGRWNSDFLIY